VQVAAGSHDRPPAAEGRDARSQGYWTDNRRAEPSEVDRSLREIDHAADMLRQFIRRWLEQYVSGALIHPQVPLTALSSE
jgi:hypothetical protein